MKSRLLRHKHAAPQQRGAALISSLVLVAGIASLGAGLVQISSVSTRRQNLSLDTTHALYIAEAGLSEAYFAVAQGRSGAIASPAEPAELNGAYYWVEATELGGNRVALQAIGLYGRGKFSIGITLNRSVNEVAQMGICGLKDVTVGEGSQIRSVNSNLDHEGGVVPLAPDDVPDPVNLRSNGDITIYSPVGVTGPGSTHIQGNVRPGPNGIVDADVGTTITGSQAASMRGMTLPGFTVPKLGGSTGDFSYPTGQSSITLNADIAFDNIEVPAGKTLVLQGPMRVRAENLVVGVGAEVVIDTTGGPVGIYTTGMTTFSPGSILNNIGDDPTQCSLFALATERDKRSQVIMGAKGEFKGMIVAPRSTVAVPGDLLITGSIVGEHLFIGNNAVVEFAEDLRDGGYGIKMTPTMVSWEIWEVPDTPITRGNKPIDSKFRDLGITTKPTASAQPEQDVRINYSDTMGVSQFYDGPLSGMPWANVDSVLDMDWYLMGIPQGVQRPSVVIDAIDDKRGNVDAVAFPEG